MSDKVRQFQKTNLDRSVQYERISTMTFSVIVMDINKLPGNSDTAISEQQFARWRWAKATKSGGHVIGEERVRTSTHCLRYYCKKCTGLHCEFYDIRSFVLLSLLHSLTWMLAFHLTIISSAAIIMFASRVHCTVNFRPPMRLAWCRNRLTTTLLPPNQVYDLNRKRRTWWFPCWKCFCSAVVLR